MCLSQFASPPYSILICASQQSQYRVRGFFAEANDALLTDRNVHDHASIFYIEEHTFGEGTVSWTATIGSYYIQTVARDKYAKSLELWEQAKAKSAATGRRSRKIASREQSESAG